MLSPVFASLPLPLLPPSSPSASLVSPLAYPPPPAFLMSPADDDRRGRRSGGAGMGRVAAGRVTALVTSVMDLHVRIALQEVDHEKRRLVSGGVLLAGARLVRQDRRDTN